MLGLMFLLSGSLLACIVLRSLLDLQRFYALSPVSEDGEATEPD